MMVLAHNYVNLFTSRPNGFILMDPLPDISAEFGTLALRVKCLSDPQLL